jgi:hypothetical protein
MVRDVPLAVNGKFSPSRLSSPATLQIFSTEGLSVNVTIDSVETSPGTTPTVTVALARSGPGGRAPSPPWTVMSTTYVAFVPVS